MSRLRLTYLINHIDYGGAEIGMVRLVSGLDRANIDITIVTLKHANPDLISDIPDNVEVKELNLASEFKLGKLARLRRIVSRSDILVCSLFPSVLVGSVLGTVSRTPKIFSWKHVATELSWIRGLMNRTVYALSDGVLVDSQSTANEVASNSNLNDREITTLPLSGVDCSEFPTVDHSTDGQVHVGSVGRLVEKKGYQGLLQCAANLSEYEFHIVGDGPLRETLESQRPENVTLHGRVSQERLDELWNTFDVYFQPSRSEGLCITGIEAMACGLPVVASDIDGLSESVVDGETGYLVPEGDIQGFVEAIEALADDVDRRAKFGQAGRGRVKEHYSQEALAEKFTDRVLCPDGLEE